MRRVYRESDARRELRSVWLQILSKNERNWYMEVAIGEGRRAFNMEKGMAQRDQEDEEFASEIQGVDRKRPCFHM